MKKQDREQPEWADLARPGVLSQPVYQPGKPIDDAARELGLDPTTVLKLASNENALGASPAGMEGASKAIREMELYPDGGAVRLRARLAESLHVADNQVVVGNGSNEILELLGHVFLGPGDEVVMGDPAFAVYKLVTLLFGAKPVEVPLVDYRHDLAAMRDAITERTKLVFLPSPNNPTGTSNTMEELAEFVQSLPPHVVFVYDEAYVEYLDNPPDLRRFIAEGYKVICTRTFSKIYGLAGLRLGYGYAAAELITLLNRVRQPFNVNAVALAAGEAALGDHEWVLRSRESNTRGLGQLSEGFHGLNLEFIPSVANFITVRVGDGAGVFEKLQLRGVIVRPMGSYGMAEWIRVSVGTEEQNERALEELRALMTSELQ